MQANDFPELMFDAHVSKSGVAVRAVAVLLAAVGRSWCLGSCTLVLGEIKQSTCVVISLLLPISSTGDGCCSCQNLRTLSFPEVCKVFWVQPIELRCGVAVIASRCQRKLLLRPLSQNVSTTQHGVRAAMLRIGRSSARASAEAKAKSKSEAREFGEEGWSVGAVLLTVDMLWGGKDGPNFRVGMCSEIWLRFKGPPLYHEGQCQKVMKLASLLGYHE